MRSLGFVDRLVAPWMETAQRSSSLRMFTQFASSGVNERAGGAVSWVFPRPWYQDELDWMAAARDATSIGSGRIGSGGDRAMLTTRGTYVAQGAPQELVAPGLSVARTQTVAPSFGAAADLSQQYSPLVPLAAVSAAQLMARVVAP
jgi:hypothetical protein